MTPLVLLAGVSIDAMQAKRLSDQGFSNNGDLIAEPPGSIIYDTLRWE